MGLGKADQDSLESMIDRSNVSEVIESMAEVCYEKGSRLRENWQDDISGALWDKLGDRLNRVANKIGDGGF